MPQPFTRRAFLGAAAATTGAALGAPIRLSLGAEPKNGAQPRFRGKFAICNETFGDWPLEKAFDFTAQAGYEGVEIAPFTISDYVTSISAAQRTEIRKQAEKAGLRVAGLHWLLAKTQGFHLTSPDRAVRRRTADYLVALGRFCADIGGNLLVFGSPRQRNLLPGVSQEHAVKYALEVLRAALPGLERANVSIAIEPLSPKITDFLPTAAETAKLVKMVDSPRCGLILDCNAMSTESTSIPKLIRRHRSHLMHFHANDPNQRGPGFGKLDFVPIFRALREIDYDGWVSVEVFDYKPGPERLARDSIQYMKKCLAASA